MYDRASDGIASDFASDSVMDMMFLTTAVQTAYDMITAVNLTKNRYYVMDQERINTPASRTEGVFDDVFEEYRSKVPVSHRKEFSDTYSRASLIKAYREGKKSVRLEYPQYSNDGTLHWLSTRVLFLEDARNGDLLEISLSHNMDKEIEEREKTRKILSDALHLAHQANSAKYDFLSRMSHDIRTPLNAIIGMTTIISANLDDKNKINDCLLKIGTSSKYLLGIVNDVLDYTRIENGNLALNMYDFNLRDLVSEIIAETSEKAKAKGQSVSVTVSDKISNSYIGDEYRIRQVLTNLLDNAFRYTGEGGEYSLDVDIARHADDYDMLVFKVKDNGVGIAPEFISQIFEPFSQGSNADTVENIGLGLSIARNLAHLMNGDIGVVSELGKGSEFAFEVPLEHGNLTAYSETIDTDINVLVVDDDIDVCEYTSILLHGMGISAKITDNGFDAVKLVKTNVGTPDEFDVAIIDWKMPDIDGIETVIRIRKIVGNDVLVIVMSAFDWSNIENEAREAGVDLFLAKPISETNLRTAIACSERIKREQENITFNGEKVLIAEDNEFNAEIAKAILEMKNLKIDIASNGKQAYDMFTSSENGEYLAIFMDIIMPVLDGHEATRAIRSSNHPEAKTVPIYAMTANAFHNDILEAKLSGMNGHISKPVDFGEVARVLQSIVKNQQKTKFTNGGGTKVVIYTKLTKAGVNIDTLLQRLMGNDSLIRVFIKKFTEDRTILALRAAFADKDMKAAEMASHTLKGICGNLSLEELYALFTHQTDLIRSGEYEKAEEMMASIESKYSSAIVLMKEWLEEI